MAKLNQVIAIEKGVKTKVNNEFTELHKSSQKPALFDGFSKTYTRLHEDGELQPPQSQRVQLNAQDVLRTAANKLTELFDVTAAKDFANCSAKADVKVDGEVMLSGVPATYLLFLEKQLTDLHTFVDKLPVLDPAEEWSLDSNQSLYRSKPTQTSRTKKVQKPIVLAQATDKHPAQTQLITEDEVVGTWDLVKFSGALPAPRKQQLLDRVVKLLKAVKFAREEANCVAAPEQNVGDKIFGWLLS